MIPTYKAKHKSSLGLLYRPLQDIEIYVEDADSEVFYTNLFGRLLHNTIKIKKVIPLGCRLEVIKGAELHDNSSPRVYIIDGDLYWVSQTFENNNPRLFQYDFYCVENALFCKEAAISIIQETLGNTKKTDIEQSLKWDDWEESINDGLNRLFIVFASAFKLMPSIKTTSRGFESIITRIRKSPPKFETEKIDSIIDEITSLIENELGKEIVDETILQISNWVQENSFQFKIVSGKDFLLPLLMFKIKEICGIDLTIDSRNFRLANHCNLEPLQPLKKFIIDTVKAHAA